MPSHPFVHLHTHSEFSLLDGAARLDALVERAVELEMPALALTDHGVMYGAFDFYKSCKKAGIKPIIGMEAYVAPNGHQDKTPRKGKSSYHLTLLARNGAGYHNLMRLATIAAVDGFYSKPRIDVDLLDRHREGLIVLSGCISGEMSVALLEDDHDRALAVAARYRDMLGSDAFYVELQDHGLDRQAKVNAGALRIARELGLRVVCTNDVHYLTDADAGAHDVLLCIGTGARVQEEKRLRYDSDQFYFKTGDEMAERFAEHPDALASTLDIADACDLTLSTGRTDLPTPYIPEGLTPIQHLTNLAQEGLRRRVATVTENHERRLAHELGVIDKAGFAEYILIVRDFAAFSRSRGIYFGVRGSAAGSLTSYCVDITDVDPVHYDLTFERFLNPSRLEMPDIDMDFEDSRRSEVIDYVTEKYGRENVAQIITFGTLAAKAALKDAGRALGVPLALVNKIASLVPSVPVGVTLSDCLKHNEQFRALYDEDAQIRDLVDTALRLEGVSRHSSVHAAGVVISKAPLIEHTPLQKSGDGYVTQYPAKALAEIGLLKMDFLGLINLSILGKSLENIRKTRGVEVAIGDIPLDDKPTFDLLGRGETMGVFQLESSGMRRHIAALKPTSVQEVAAMVALYRPGPMASISTFIDAKHGRRKVTYPHPKLEPALKETYGIIVYQDQVLSVARDIAGFTMGDADLLRRAISKKLLDKIQETYEQFIAGAMANGLSKQQAEDIYALIKPFAGYGFNKAHAVCYALLAYQTAYLKANYPVEYMAALLACYVEKPDKMAVGLAECRRMGIEVLGPDINASEADFAPSGTSVRFGLAAVKNVGRSAAEAILASREADGPFRSLDDLCRRMQSSTGVTKSTLETLILCGALDSVHPNRRATSEALDAALRTAARLERDRASGQELLFGCDGPAADAASTILPDVPDYPSERRLASERELLGVYLSGHPLDRIKTADSSSVHIAELAERPHDEAVSLTGMVAHIRPFQTRANKEPMAFIVLEDTTGRVPVTVFPRLYKECSSLLTADRVVRVVGRLSERDAGKGDEESERNIEIIADAIQPVAAVSDGNGAASSVHIRLDAARSHVLHLLRSTLERHPGTTPVVLHVSEADRTARIRARLAVDLCPAARMALEQLVGRQAVWVE